MEESDYRIGKLTAGIFIVFLLVIFFTYLVEARLCEEGTIRINTDAAQGCVTPEVAVSILKEN